MQMFKPYMLFYLFRDEIKFSLIKVLTAFSDAQCKKIVLSCSRHITYLQKFPICEKLTTQHR